MNVNARYKDSVFSLLFSDPDVLRELYCALEGVTLRLLLYIARVYEKTVKGKNLYSGRPLVFCNIHLT